MKPCAYTHRESGDNVLLGVALIEAWDRQDRSDVAALLASEPDSLSSVIGVLRAAHNVAVYLSDDAEQYARALDFARTYGLMRRDDLGGDEIINQSNVES